MMRSINALMSALLVSRVWTLDCDPSNFYANGNNDYPNTYYCADERGTWENGRYFGACRRDGSVESCSCVTVVRELLCLNIPKHTMLL